MSMVGNSGTDPDEADWSRSEAEKDEGPSERGGPGRSEWNWKPVLDVIGAVIFMALEFMFYYMVGFAAVMIGFVRGNRKGGRR